MVYTVLFSCLGCLISVNFGAIASTPTPTVEDKDISPIFEETASLAPANDKEFRSRME